MRRERKGHTLQPTALVNEAFLRLVEVHGVEWQDRTHFFALAAQMMWRILVNYALARSAGKRGDAARQVSLDEAMIVSPERDSALVELDEALQALANVDDRKARVVELHFFAGLSVEEIAAVLKVSPQTVLRDWSLSKAWLAREMGRVAPLRRHSESRSSIAWATFQVTVPYEGRSLPAIRLGYLGMRAALGNVGKPAR
jgi:RNA polymerase sigma-70 factor, ECF subfamily